MMRVISRLSVAACLAALPLGAMATPFTTTVPGTGLTLPTDYPEAGGVVIVLIGANGNAYFQFSDPTGAFRGFNNRGTPDRFEGNPFTINDPISLDCGFSSCSDYFGGSISQGFIRFTAFDGDTQVGGFDEDDISLLLNGFNVGNWSDVQTEITNNAGTVGSGFQTGFGNNSFNTGWFETTNAGLLANILSTNQTLSQVLDDDPNDNFWDFRRGNSLTNQDIVTVAPGYQLEKVSDVPTYNAVGDQITYTYTVTNIGSVPIRNVSVVDDQIANVTCDKTTIQDTQPGGVADFATCTGTDTITQEDIDNGSLTNIASVDGTPDFGSLGTLIDSVTVSGPPANPSIDLVKSTTLATFGNAGTTVPYTFEVTNDGNVTLTDVEVSDPLVPGLSCSFATLLPGVTETCTANYTVEQSDVDDFVISGTTLDNTATATGTPPTGADVDDTDTLSLDGPAAAPALTVDKVSTTANFAAVGDVIDYEITVTNTGNVTFPTAPTVNDPLTGGATCPAGAVAPGASVVCTASYTVDQDDLDAGEVANTASAEITVGGETAMDGDSATVPANRTTGLEVEKSLAAGSPNPISSEDDELVFEFVVTNTGNVTLNAPVIDDDLVTATCADATVPAGGSITCTSDPYDVTLADIQAGSVTNTASAEATDPLDGSVIQAPEDSVTVPVAQVPALSLAKSTTLVGDYDTVGQDITYEYALTNTGNIAITEEITVDDDLIATVSCPVLPSDGLAPGDTLTCTGTYEITQDDIDNGSVTNIATADVTQPVVPLNPGDPTEVTVTTDPSTVTINAAQDVTLDVDKRVQAGSPTTYAAPGDVVTFEYEITNSGNVTLDGPITLVDDQIAGTLSCGPGPLAPGASVTCSQDYVADQAAIDAGEVTNIAVASAVFDGAGVDSDPDSVTVPADQMPELTLEKLFVSGIFGVGRPSPMNSRSPIPATPPSPTR